MKCQNCKHEMVAYNFNNEYGDWAETCEWCNTIILHYNNKTIMGSIEENLGGEEE